MREQILAMSGNFDNDFESYLQVNNLNMESAAVTIVECGTVHCTAILC